MKDLLETPSMNPDMEYSGDDQSIYSCDFEEVGMEKIDQSPKILNMGRLSFELDLENDSRFLHEEQPLESSLPFFSVPDSVSKRSHFNSNFEPQMGHHKQFYEFDEDRDFKTKFFTVEHEHTERAGFAVSLVCPENKREKFLFHSQIQNPTLIQMQSVSSSDVLSMQSPEISQSPHTDLCDYKREDKGFSLTEKEDNEVSLSESNDMQNSIKSSRGRKSHFTPEDDLELKNMVQKYGDRKWSKIASVIGRYNRKQLRDRYVHFHQQKNKLSPFSEEEDSKIFSCLNKFGKKWERIAQEFSYRNSVSIKNRYKVLEKSRKKKLKQDQKKAKKNRILLLEESSVPEKNNLSTSNLSTIPDCSCNYMEFINNNMLYFIEFDGNNFFNQYSRPFLFLTKGVMKNYNN